MATRRLREIHCEIARLNGRIYLKSIGLPDGKPVRLVRGWKRASWRYHEPLLAGQSDISGHASSHDAELRANIRARPSWQRKEERACPRRVRDDENVFDIEQGVAISIFVERPGLERGLWRGDLWGKTAKSMSGGGRDVENVDSEAKTHSRGTLLPDQRSNAKLISTKKDGR